MAPIAPKRAEIGKLSVLPPILGHVASCESGDKDHPLGNALAKNASSTASGRFQFLRSTWVHYAKEFWGDDWAKKNVFNWDDNTELATDVYNKYGLGDWQASRFCWVKYLTTSATNAKV